jgi:hypothetical protein
VGRAPIVAQGSSKLRLPRHAWGVKVDLAAKGVVYRRFSRENLRLGEKSIEQLRDENEVFAQLAAITRVNLAASKSLA